MNLDKRWGQNIYKTVFVLFVLLSLQACSQKEQLYKLTSPDQRVMVKLKNGETGLNYQLIWEDQEMIALSQLAIFENTSVRVTGMTTASQDRIWNPVWGQFSEIRDFYNELILDLDFGTTQGKLFVRAYDKGIAFRYALTGYEEGTEATLFCEYNLAKDNNLYFPTAEDEPFGPLALSDFTLLEKQPKPRIPLVAEKSDKYLSILESDLYSAKGFDVMTLGFNKEKGMLESYNKTVLQGDVTITPWRAILLGDGPGSLVTNTVPLNLAAPNKIEDPSWIKPGKTLWDWRVHGYTAPDGFTYGINTESYLRFIDFAAENDIEYFLIDDAWYSDVNPGEILLSDKLDLEKVTRYATEKGVDLILYYDNRHGTYGDQDLFPYYQSLGMKGIKYGFMGENVPFTQSALALAAESKLLVDFHDGPVPMIGVSRTMPNAITREFCHAQQDARRAFTPETFIKMALINAIQGPLDMNNGNFDIVGINSGKRQKGPSKQGSYLSTVVSEAARTLIIHSGLVCVPDAPEAYDAKQDLFEFIKKQPVGQWDESKILYGKIGTHISTARRHGESWFVGSAIDQKGGVLNITMDFLKEGMDYEATYYEDTPETHCKTNPEAYQVRVGALKKGDVVQAKMAPGGGHCMWIRPKK